MARLEDLPSEISEGKIKFEIQSGTDTISIELCPELSDINKLRFIQNKIEQKSSEERDIHEQTEALKSIIQKSYPDKDSKWLNFVCLKYGQNILLELYFELGWRDRAEFERLKEMKEKTINNLSKKIEEEGMPKKKEPIQNL